MDNLDSTALSVECCYINEKGEIILKLKSDLMWHYADIYLSKLIQYPPLFRDEKFVSLFNGLSNYIASKVSSPLPSNYTDMYAIIEQKITKREMKALNLAVAYDLSKI